MLQSAALWLVTGSIARERVDSGAVRMFRAAFKQLEVAIDAQQQRMLLAGGCFIRLAV
jgi:hypothetical protein